jgi:ribonuclease P protein component
MRRYRLTRSQRLRRQLDFDRVHGSNVYAADKVLVVRGCANGLPNTRLAVSLSRKVGNAVVRNRWKRLVREAFRLQLPELPRGLDLVVRPRQGATADFLAIRRSLLDLTARIARYARKEVK